MAAVDSSIPDVTPGAAPETVPDVVQPVEEVKPEEPKDAAPETNGTENCEPHAEDKVHSVNEATNETEEALGENGAEVGGEFIHEGEEPINFEAEAVTQQPQLDVHLAVIEEQFRKGFEERYSQPSVASQRQVWEDPVETMRTNKIFREVSRGLGGDWRPIFDELMAPFPREVAELELGKISMSSPIIQGYKALSAWKEVCGRSYSLMKLVEVLRNQNFDDIADAVIHIIDHDDMPNSKDKQPKPVQRRKSDLTSQKNPAVLDNRRLLLIAKKIEGNYESLAKELGLPDEEVAEIKESEGQTYQGTFKVLWSWREARHPQPLARQPDEGSPTDVELLRAALEKVDLKAVADKIDEIK